MPRVKPLIWNRLPVPVCTQDSKSQKTQNAVTALLMATVKATNHVLQQQPSGKAQDKEIITYLTDPIALSLQCYHDINSIRCQAIKKDLHKDYAALSSAATVPVTSKYLFGDLSKLTKDISERTSSPRKFAPCNTIQHTTEIMTQMAIATIIQTRKLIWYQYTYLPNGLSSASRIFTKLLRPVYASLHTLGHLSLGYIDDSYLQGDSAKECSNIKATALLFNHLGFHLHPTKSLIITTQTLKFLGFRLDSLSMTVSPTRKIIKTVEACQRLQKWPSLKSQRM